MIRTFSIALFAGFLIACGTQKQAALTVVDEIETHYRIYKLNEWRLDGDTLRIDVQYGGGAINPHIFELVEKRTENPAKVELWLLHKTLDDRAKALIRTSLKYDIRYLLRNKKITEITLNDEARPVKKIGPTS